MKIYYNSIFFHIVEYMNRAGWLAQINNLNIWNDLKDKIIALFDGPSNNYQFYKIENDVIKQAFINIKSYKNIYIAFDIEFQTMIFNSKKINKLNNLKIDKSPKGDDIASFPREFGMIILIRDKNNDVYNLGSIHRNFRSLSDHGVDELDMKYMLETYMTVTDESSTKLLENDKIFTMVDEFDKLRLGDFDAVLNNELFVLESDSVQSKVIEIIDEMRNMDFSIETTDEISRKILVIKRLLQKLPFAVFGKYLKKTKNAFLNQFKLYYDDPLVKDRLMSKDDEKKFINAFADISHDTCFIIKGLRDLDAMINIAELVKIKKKLDFDHLYDIEIFNGFSKIKYNDAKLETTYEGVIKTPIYKNNSKDLIRILDGIGGTAHNPVTDSYYTLIVALIINMGLNDYFNEQKGGSHKTFDIGELYVHLYQKEKQKYINQKIN